METETMKLWDEPQLVTALAKASVEMSKTMSVMQAIISALFWLVMGKNINTNKTDNTTTNNNAGDWEAQ